MKDKKILSLALKVMIPVVVLTVLLILKFTVFTKEELSLARYAIVGVEGFDGNAKATVALDDTGLYKALCGKDATDADRQEYEEFVNSVTCFIDKNDKLSNGDNIKVSVEYDKEVADRLGVRVDITEREYRVSGLRTGVELDLFEDVKIITGGISPFVYVTCINESDDEYLKSLEYTIDKTSGLAIGDEITITCNIDKDRAESLNYYYDTNELKYTITVADAYVNDLNGIDMDIINGLEEENVAVIINETADTTYHMSYKVTLNSSYLYRDNNEEAVGFKLYEVILADNATNVEQEHENYVFAIYRGSIALPKYTTEADPYDYIDAYFCFKYSDAVISKDGEFLMATNNPENRYACAGSYELIVKSITEDIGGGYTLYEYNNNMEEW